MFQINLDKPKERTVAAHQHELCGIAMVLHGNSAALTCRTFFRTASRTRSGRWEPLCSGPRQRAHTATLLRRRDEPGIIVEEECALQKISPAYPSLFAQGTAGTPKSILWFAPPCAEKPKMTAATTNESHRSSLCWTVPRACAPSHCVFIHAGPDDLNVDCRTSIVGTT